MATVIAAGWHRRLAGAFEHGVISRLGNHRRDARATLLEYSLEAARDRLKPGLQRLVPPPTVGIASAVTFRSRLGQCAVGRFLAELTARQCRRVDFDAAAD